MKKYKGGYQITKALGLSLSKTDNVLALLRLLKVKKVEQPHRSPFYVLTQKQIDFLKAEIFKMTEFFEKQKR